MKWAQKGVKSYSIKAHKKLILRTEKEKAKLILDYNNKIQQVAQEMGWTQEELEAQLEKSKIKLLHKAIR